MVAVLPSILSHVTENIQTSTRPSFKLCCATTPTHPRQVYVCYDRRLKRLPVWLMYFESTDWVVHTTDAAFGVWRKRYAKGKVCVLPCCAVIDLAVPYRGVLRCFMTKQRFSVCPEVFFLVAALSFWTRTYFSFDTASLDSRKVLKVFFLFFTRSILVSYHTFKRNTKQNATNERKR